MPYYDQSELVMAMGGEDYADEHFPRDEDSDAEPGNITPLRAWFIDMLQVYPGPDAEQYAAWARSSAPEDTERLIDYVRCTIGAIERVGSNDERAYLTNLRDLLRELTSSVGG